MEEVPDRLPFSALLPADQHQAIGDSAGRRLTALVKQLQAESVKRPDSEPSQLGSRLWLLAKATGHYVDAGGPECVPLSIAVAGCLATCLESADELFVPVEETRES